MEVSRKQAAYLRTKPKRINVLYGSVRSGKTYVSLLQWAAFVRSRDAGDEFLMMGRTLTALKRNCLNLLADLVGERNFSFSMAGKEGRLFGRRIWLEGADNERAESKLRGMTLAGVYADELTTLPQSVTMMAFSRISLKGARFFATTNPDDPENYVNRDILLNEGIDRAAWKFTLEDNPFLDSEYVAQLKREYTGVFYERFILGNFVRAEGVIFRQFADAPKRWTLSEVPEDCRFMTFGVDFGVNHSKTVFICTGIRERGAGVVVLEEFRMECKGVRPDEIEAAFVSFAERCVRKYPRLKAAYCWTDQPETLTHGIAAAVRRAGLPFAVTIARKRPINERVYAKERMLNLGKWAVMEGCPMVIFSTANQLWDEKKGEKGVDARLDNDPAVNDVADAEEYSWEAFIDEMGVRS